MEESISNTWKPPQWWLMYKASKGKNEVRFPLKIIPWRNWEWVTKKWPHRIRQRGQPLRSVGAKRTEQCGRENDDSGKSSVIMRIQRSFNWREEKTVNSTRIPQREEKQTEQKARRKQRMHKSTRETKSKDWKEATKDTKVSLMTKQIMASVSTS